MYILLCHLVNGVDILLNICYNNYITYIKRKVCINIMAEAKKLSFPKLEPFLYRNLTMYELLDEYIKELRKQGDLSCMLYANKLVEYKNMTANPQVLQQLEEDFVQMKGILTKWRKDSQTPFSVSIFKRRKNFIGMNEKIRLFLKKGKSLSTLNDALGFRILVGNGQFDTEESIEACYEILDKVIEFFVNEKQCYPCEIDGIPKKQEYNSYEGSKIVIPSKNYIPEELRNNVKDYIRFPKANGYQSLHIIFRTTSGICFEVQIRTQAMHLHAEYGQAEHTGYKKNRYADNESEKITFIKENVKILGYVAFIIKQEDGTTKKVVHDLVGLDTSIDQFNLLIG